MYEAHRNEQNNPIKGEEFVFPNISMGGALKYLEKYPAEPYLSNMLNKIATRLNIIEEGSGNKYTLHCFRRGGAQLRYFDQKNNWPIDAVKAWAGWAKIEGHQTLINYIMNESERRETYFGDMASPLRRDANRAAHDQTEVVDVNPDSRFTSIERTLNTISTQLVSQSNHLVNMQRDITTLTRRNGIFITLLLNIS